jgi:hypothetical protein
VNSCELIRRINLLCGLCGCPAVHAVCSRPAVVCSSKCGSLWQCSAVPSAVCGSGWQCAAVPPAVCGSAHGSVWQCVLHMYTLSRSEYILVCSHRGSGNNEPHIPRMLILTAAHSREHNRAI